MMLALTGAMLYLGQLLVKAALAETFARRQRTPLSPTDAGVVTILQPILGGDPNLSGTLEANVRALPEARFLWLVDRDDPVALSVCRELAARHPMRDLALHESPPPPQGVNPKVFKLARVLEAVTTTRFVVLDDDTRLNREGLQALVLGLDRGATLSTGLPRYHAAAGRWSGWLAEFVNTNAVLTYLPALAFSSPLSIHGMCYAMNTTDARRLNVFRHIERALTDDLALALLVRAKGLRLHQTIVPHDIATSVASLPALLRLLHRWFVFTRLLVGHCPPLTRVALAVAYGAPPLLLTTLLRITLLNPTLTFAGLLGGTLLLRGLILWGVKRRFLGAGVPSRPVASVILEMIQPAFLASAYVWRTIRWRTRTIRVRAVDDFEYV